MRRSLLRIRLVAPLLALLLVACAPGWTVVRRSGPPSALAGATELGVAFDWSAVTIEGRPESEWLATRTPDQQRSYLEARAAIMTSFIEELAVALDGVRVIASTGAERVQLVARPTAIDLGAFAYMTSRESRLATTLVWSVGGAETDEVSVRASAPSNALNADVLSRMRACGQRAARAAAGYLAQAR